MFEAGTEPTRKDRPLPSDRGQSFINDFACTRRVHFGIHKYSDSRPRASVGSADQSDILFQLRECIMDAFREMMKIGDRLPIHIESQKSFPV